MKDPTSSARSAGDLRPWLTWLAAFFASWAIIVFAGGYWSEVTAHWPIAVAMAAGSYVAGATPMGGGTIGFPILVLLFDQPADIGRNFSFAVQSIGMTSASIFIVCTRQPVAWRMLGWAVLGAAISTPLGLMTLAPVAPDTLVKVLFAVLWASFGVMTLFKVGEFSKVHGITPATPAFDRNVGLFVGLFGGGCIASLTGVGIDMLIYTMLVLLCRADLRIAIPTSVVLMAATSLIGILSANLIGPVKAEVFYNWLAAAPIVIFGAPLGAYVVTLISRTPTLYFVAVLCVGQFVWTCIDQRLSAPLVIVAVIGVLAANAVFHFLYLRGLALSRRGVAERAAADELVEPAADA